MAFIAGRTRFTHHRDIAQHIDPGSVSITNDHRSTFARFGIGVSYDHHDEKVSISPIRGKPFMAVDNVFVTVAHRTSGQHRRVGTSAWFGHGETTAQLPG